MNVKLRRQIYIIPEQKNSLLTINITANLLLDLGSKSCPAPRKMLVFINPCSGTGNARKIFNGKPKQILHEADILYEVVITGMFSLNDFTLF